MVLRSTEPGPMSEDDYLALVTRLQQAMAIEPFRPSVIDVALLASEWRMHSTEIERLRESNADDIRALGWAVAVHNDYWQDGKSLTKDGHAVKGEGPTDCDALNAVRHEVARLGNSKDG
jgi:hypothetical protein